MSVDDAAVRFDSASRRTAEGSGWARQARGKKAIMLLDQTDYVDRVQSKMIETCGPGLT